MGNFVTRAEWGARPATGQTPRSLEQITDYVVHHSDTQLAAAADHAGCAAAVRGIQAYHQDHNGWADIGYHRLACAHGYIFEGRPLTDVGAHVFGFNANSVGLCFIEAGEPEPAAAAAASLEQIRADENTIGRGLTLWTHREAAAHVAAPGWSTSCPGDPVEALVTYWRGGGPRPFTPPAPQPAQSWTETYVSELPTIKAGAKGAAVVVAQGLLLAAGEAQHLGPRPLDGIFGAGTDAAVRAVQTRHGLHVDGTIGRDTYRVLLGVK